MKKLTSHLYFWVLVAILCGGILGYLDPKAGVNLKPLGDAFKGNPALLNVKSSVRFGELMGC